MAEPATTPPADSERLTAARGIVARFSKYAAVGGLVPVPLVDMAAIAAVQVKMLEQLSNLYGVAFRENLGKEVIGTIIGVGTTYNFGNAALLGFNQYIRFVPVIGQLFGLAVVPAVAAATTNALGRVFVRHFESGGQLLDLDLGAAKEAFKADFARTRCAPAADAATASA